MNSSNFYAEFPRSSVKFVILCVHAHCAYLHNPGNWKNTLHNRPQQQQIDSTNSVLYSFGAESKKMLKDREAINKRIKIRGKLPNPFDNCWRRASTYILVDKTRNGSCWLRKNRLKRASTAEIRWTLRCMRVDDEGWWWGLMMVTLSLIPYHNRTGRYRNFRTIKVIYMRGECSSQGFEQLEAKSTTILISYGLLQRG
jgi:hypothetical protein